MNIPNPFTHDNTDDSEEQASDHPADTTDTTDSTDTSEAAAERSKYAITETGVESVGETAVSAQTAREGTVAGPDVRELLEATPQQGRGPLWVGYDADAQQGFREAPLPFEALFRHLWVTGTTGYGKTTTLLNQMVQLAHRGHGFVYIDPKGQDAHNLLQKLPADRLEDVVWVAPGDTDHENTVGVNFLASPTAESTVRRENEIETRLATLKAVLKNDDYWGVNMESITESMGRAMLQSETAYSLVDMYNILRERERRDEFAESVDDPYVRAFCEEIAAMNDKTIRPLLKRLKAWVENPVIRRIIGHRDATLDFQEIIANDRIVIVQTPVENQSIKQMVALGVLRQLWSAVRRRPTPETGTPDPYFVVCDEFDAIASPSLDIEGMLARARSHRLSVTLACQYPSQLTTTTQQAVQNNCDTLLAFSVNDPSDARSLMNRFQNYTAEDLLATGRYHVWTKLPRSNTHDSQPVRLTTFPPYPPRRTADAVDDIITQSLDKYGTPRQPHRDRPADGASATDLAGGSELARVMAAATRAVQLRQEGQSTNAWVPAAAVETELSLRLTHPHSDSDASSHNLTAIRNSSPLFEQTTDAESEERVRLTDAGTTAATPTTGAVQSAGGDAHDNLLLAVEQALTTRGFSVAIREQDGSSQPDATAVHPQYEGVFAIEAETTTPDRPAAVLTNLARAHATNHTPVFVVRPGDTQTELADRLAGILAQPRRTRPDEPAIFYNTAEYITFNGGATAHNGTTAIRPATTSPRTRWTQTDTAWVLSDGDTEFTQHPPTTPFVKTQLPAVYSYDRTTGQYTVHTQETTTTYQSKDRFNADWTPIKRPFIPSHDLPHPNYTTDDYTILILPPNTPPLVYKDGTTRRLADHPDPHHLWPTTATATPTPDHPPDTPSPSLDESIDSVSEGVDAFIDDYLTHDPDAEHPQADIYTAYTTWTEQAGVDTAAQRWFTRILRNTLDVDIKRVRRDGDRSKLYTGVTLTPDGATLLDE